MRMNCKEIRSSSYQDIDENYALVDVVVSSGAYVYRDQRNPSTGKWEPFMRGLEISPEAIRFGRLKAGAPVLNNHKDDESISDVVGSVDNCWIESGEDGKPLLMATLKLSKVSANEKEISQKIKSGIIRAVSVGAEIHREEDVTSSEDNITKLIATDWEPYEISLVPVPADERSIIRSKSKSREDVMSKSKVEQPKNEKRMSTEEVVEDALVESLDGKVADDMVDDIASEVATEATAAVEEMVEDMTDGEMTSDEMMGEADKEKLADEEDKEELAEEEDKEEYMEDGEKEKLRKAIARVLARKGLLKAKRSGGSMIKSRRSRVSVNEDHKIKYARETRAKVGAVLTAKISNNIAKDDLSKNEFRHMSFLDITKELLYRDGNHESRNWLPAQIYDHVLGSKRFEKRSSAGPFAVSSDFVNLFTDSVNKAVQQSYEFQRGKQTFDQFVTRTQVNDFKIQERVSLGEFGKLQQTLPGADSPITPMSDSKEEYRLATYSNTFQITRQGFIDDDTGQLNQVLTSGMSAADLESDLVYQQFTNGEVGGQPWARAENRNLTTGAPLNASANPYAGIKAIYNGLAKQTGLDVDTPLGLTFKHLLVPVALHFEALQTQGVAYPANSNTPNPYATMYEITHEPRLDNDSTTSYYGIAAEAGTFRNFIELAYLKGQSTPIMKFQESFSNDVLSWKMTHDVAAKILDYRLAYKVTA